MTWVKRQHTVLVIGSGSIGKRHLKNLQTLGARVAVVTSRPVHEEPEFRDVPIFKSINEAMQIEPEGAVIANRTDLHLPAAREAASLGLNLFIEKPLSHKWEGVLSLLELERTRELVVESGFVLRAHPNVRTMKSWIESGKLGRIHYGRFNVGQHLGDWRPSQDYRACYSAFKDQGGGVVMDLIHDIDLAYLFLGPVKDVTAFMARSIELEIETESIAQIGLMFESGALAQIHLDYVRPTYNRMAEIVGTNGILSWDYSQGAVSFSNREGVWPLENLGNHFDRNDVFLTHMEHFLKRFETPEISPISPLCDSAEVLKVALAAKVSFSDRRFIRPHENEEVFS